MAPAVIAALLGLLGTGVGVGAQFLGRRKLTGAQNQQNAWNAEEAQKQRDFEEEMRNTSFQAQVKDMQAAGVNPALMYGGAGSSGATVPSGAAATGSGDGMQLDPSSMIDSIMQLSLLAAQKENIEADTRQKNAAANEKETLTPMTVKEIEQKIKESNQNISESEARTASALAQSLYVSKQTQWYDAIAGTQVALNQAYESLADAQKSNHEQQVKESEQRIKNLKQEYVESVARCAVYAANAGYLDQMTVNAMEEQGLIEMKRGALRTEWQINDKVLENYDTDKWFIRSQQAMSAVRDLGIGAGSVMSSGMFTAPMRKIGY